MFALSDSAALAVSRTDQPIITGKKEGLPNMDASASRTVVPGPRVFPNVPRLPRRPLILLQPERGRRLTSQKALPQIGRGPRFSSACACVHVLSQTSSCVGQQVLVHLTSPLISCYQCQTCKLLLLFGPKHAAKHTSLVQVLNLFNDNFHALMIKSRFDVEKRL